MRSFKGSVCCLSAFFVLSVSAAFSSSPLKTTNLRCEYKTNPVGIDILQPRFSWELMSAERGTLQTAYEIRVAESESDLAKNKLAWDSGKQASDASIHVVYQGRTLESGRRYYWQVQV